LQDIVDTPYILGTLKQERMQAQQYIGAASQEQLSILSLPYKYLEFWKI
jgi:hypothetical protein